jgi:hypothetical protein
MISAFDNTQSAPLSRQEMLRADLARAHDDNASSLHQGRTLSGGADRGAELESETKSYGEKPFAKSKGFVALSNAGPRQSGIPAVNARRLHAAALH